MSKKNRRKKARLRPPPPQQWAGAVPGAAATGGTSTPGAAATGPAAGSLSSQPGGPTPTSVAARPQSLAAQITGPRRAAGAAGVEIDIDARVPYFASDLRRIVLTAAVMVLLIVAASFALR